MENNKALFDTLMSAIADPVLVTDLRGHIVRVSPLFEVVTKLSSAELIGQHIENLDGGNAPFSVSQLINEALAAGVVRTGMVALPGQQDLWELSSHSICDHSGIIGAVSILRPVKISREEYREGFDELTGLPNHHLFNDRIEQALNNAQRGKKSVVLMLTAIDRFSELNDLLGEQAGNQILRDIAERLGTYVRTSDTVARLEGDRFAFAMEISAADHSVLLAEKILGAFEQPFQLQNQKDVVITCSVGVGIYPADGTTPQELMKNAAVALHHIKEGGHNRYQFFSNEMNTRARHRLDIESGIRRALRNGELIAYYQPKISIHTRELVGMEALVRWRDPGRGLVPPGEFIPIAEESGLIEQIGQWMLEETCAQNQRWQAQGLHPICASVNVSARQFRNRNFVSLVEDVLQRTGLDPQWLELEITESVLMGDIESIVARMEALRRLGVSLSIDDFGTGYSSLSYLSRFPIATLKIDRAFIADVQTNPNTAEIARAIIGLSRGLNLAVVAEGAEVIEQVDFLKDHGCDLVQGYFYSKPLPAEEFAILLRNGLPPL
jgi:diguanylate cyclase (GGDEF)-like protein